MTLQYVKGNPWLHFASGVIQAADVYLEQRTERKRVLKEKDAKRGVQKEAEGTCTDNDTEVGQ